MTVATRIYVVTDTETTKQRLIRAATQAQALRVATTTRFTVDVASQDALVGLLSSGVIVEEAKEDKE